MIQRIEPEEPEVSQAAVDFELRRLIQFYGRYMPPHQVQAQMESLRQRAREQATGLRKLIREARRRSIPVSEEDVDRKLEQFVDEAGGPEAFDELLDRQEITMDLMRESLRDSLRVDTLIREITASVREPTEAEIRDHFEKHRDDFKRAERRRAQHILVKPASKSPEDRAAARQQLLDIKRKAEAGASFSDLAAAHSHCPSGRRAGGSIGWVTRGTMLPAFDLALFACDIGVISDIVETPLGYHILMPNDADEGGPADYEEVKESIRELIRHGRRGHAISDYLAGMKPPAAPTDIPR